MIKRADGESGNASLSLRKLLKHPPTFFPNNTTGGGCQPQGALGLISRTSRRPPFSQTTHSMTTQLAIKPERVSALNIMGARLSVDPIKLMATLKATVFKNASDDELLALVVVANEYRLNPLTKEIYAFPAKSGGIVPVVSIDGWVSMVNDHPAMDGMEFEEHYRHSNGPRLVSDRGDFPTVQDGLREAGIERAFYHRNKLDEIR